MGQNKFLEKIINIIKTTTSRLITQQAALLIANLSRDESVKSAVFKEQLIDFIIKLLSKYRGDSEAQFSLFTALKEFDLNGLFVGLGYKNRQK